jgi:hypothetical protein
MVLLSLPKTEVSDFAVARLIFCLAIKGNGQLWKAIRLADSVTYLRETRQWLTAVGQFRGERHLGRRVFADTATP